MGSVIKDLTFWEGKEAIVADYYRGEGWEVRISSRWAILDFLITKWKKQMFLELKTRRCKSLTYPTTMIGANKKAEAIMKWDKEWIETRFLFLFEDWLFELNPFTSLPIYERKLWRWDRWDIDKKKLYLYYNISDLCLLTTTLKE